MAEDLDDGEFWLPSQFLTEEDILSDFGASTPTTGVNSDLGSPGDSLTETESDEDEFFAELTRRMSRSSLLQDLASTNSKGVVLSRSPQSTLFPVGGSSRGSPTDPVSPSPASGCFRTDDATSCDVLNAAAGQVARLRMRTEQLQQQQKGTGYFDSSRGFLYPPRKQQTSPVSLRPDFRSFFYHKTEFPHQQQAPRFPQRNHTENADFFHRGRSNNIHLHNRTLGLSPAAWPPLGRPVEPQTHAQNLSAGTKTESVGTGVFLPRRVNVSPNPTESRRVRNKNDSTGRFRGQNNGFHAPRRHSENAERPVSGCNPTEIRLPSEWTY